MIIGLPVSPREHNYMLRCMPLVPVTPLRSAETLTHLPEEPYNNYAELRWMCGAARRGYNLSSAAGLAGYRKFHSKVAAAAFYGVFES